MNKQRENFRRNFSGYRSMWIMVTFDLPTLTPAHKKAYTTFRKFLLSDGFSMHQYSVYVRHCASLENTEVHEQRIKKNMPNEGTVSIIRITDKQFGNIVNLYGKKEKKLPRASNQLEIFLMMGKSSGKKKTAVKKRKSPRKFCRFQGDLSAFRYIFFRGGFSYLLFPSALRRGRM